MLNFIIIIFFLSLYSKDTMNLSDHLCVDKELFLKRMRKKIQK